MPLKAPTIQRDWQKAPQPEYQPTCYEQRDPIRHWCRSCELEYEDAEDREEVQAWVASSSSASSIGAIQARTANSQERQHAIRANAEHRAEQTIIAALACVAVAMDPRKKSR